MEEYGLLGPTDPAVIEGSLLAAHTLTNPISPTIESPLTFKILEIGVCHGRTARWIKEILDRKRIAFEYWGIDSQRDRPLEKPFPEANIVTGDSATEYHRVPDGFSWILIDGCHCANHAMLDFLHYGQKLKKRGLILFHDTNPDTQGKIDYQGHGPRDNPDMNIATRKAMALLGLADGSLKGWRPFLDRPGELIIGGVTGGITIFQKD
jgi:SAM-dependent methyltransferase